MPRLGSALSPVAQVGLYLLQAASLRLGHQELDKQRSHDADCCEYPEDGRPAYKGNQRQERLGNNEIGPPVAQGRDASAGTASIEREDFRQHYPEHRAEADGERRYVQHQTGQRDPGDDAREAGERESSTDDPERYRHAGEADEQQGFTAHAVYHGYGDYGHHHVHHPDADGGEHGGHVREPGGFDYRGSVIDDGVDPDELLEDGEPDANHEHGPDPRGEQFAVARLLSLFFLCLPDLPQLALYLFIAPCAPQNPPGLFVAVLADEPAGRLGQEVHADQQNQRGHEGERERPAPAAGRGESRVDQVGNQDAKRDRKLKQRGERPAHVRRGGLGDVRRYQG